MSPTVWDRFWGKVLVGDGCWLWTASTNRDGYGHFGIVGKSMLAHRVAYELLTKPIPEGLTLDHLCRVRHCVNPDHLEPVSQRVNKLRGEGLPARNARKTHCDHGHPFSAENTYVDARGYRLCRPCNREAAARYRARKIHTP